MALNEWLRNVLSNAYIYTFYIGRCNPNKSLGRRVHQVVQHSQVWDRDRSVEWMWCFKGSTTAFGSRKGKISTLFISLQTPLRLKKTERPLPSSFEKTKHHIRFCKVPASLIRAYIWVCVKLVVTIHYHVITLSVILFYSIPYQGTTIYTVYIRICRKVM